MFIQNATEKRRVWQSTVIMINNQQYTDDKNVVSNSKITENTKE